MPAQNPDRERKARLDGSRSQFQKGPMGQLCGRTAGPCCGTRLFVDAPPAFDSQLTLTPLPTGREEGTRPCSHPAPSPHLTARPHCSRSARPCFHYPSIDSRQLFFAPTRPAAAAPRPHGTDPPRRVTPAPFCQPTEPRCAQTTPNAGTGAHRLAGSGGSFPACGTRFGQLWGSAALPGCHIRDP